MQRRAAIQTVVLCVCMVLCTTHAHGQAPAPKPAPKGDAKDAPKGDAKDAPKGDVKDAPKSEAKQSCADDFDVYSEEQTPRGWSDPLAYHCHRAAKAASNTGDYAACIAAAKTAIDSEPHFAARTLLADCLQATNRYLEAIEVETALVKDAYKKRDYRTAQAAKRRATKLERALPVLKLLAPPDVTDLVVKLDDETAANEKLEPGIALDPGEHRIEATGKKDGKAVSFDQTVELKPSQAPISLLLQLLPAGAAPDWASQKQAKCIKEAKTPEEAAACVGGGSDDEGGGISVRIGTEVSVYHDSMDVDVISPVVGIDMDHVLDGWGLGASVLVDVVTAASVDIVATASPHWNEVRVAPEVHGHARFDPVELSIAGSLSDEPDYIATTVGGGIAVDFLDKNVTASLLYQYSHDINGRTETPFDVFSTTIDKHAGTAGLGLVLNKSTFGQGAFTYVYEDGDASKPYRHIPMFTPEVAAQIKPGLSIDKVNLARLSQRPLEQIPDKRMRYAATVLIAHRFSSNTFRVSERLYRDDWGTNATTTDMLLFVDIVKSFRMWPHLRFHAQDAANFYKLAYSIKSSSAGPVIPAIRTGDRELGPLIGATLGAGARLEVGSGEVVGLQLTGDALYTRFLNHLYVKDRWGVYGAFTMEVLLE